MRAKAFALALAWAGLVWMVFAEAREGKVSGVFLIDLFYTVSLLLVSVFLTTFIVSTIGRKFNPSPRLTIVLSAILIALCVGVEALWLRPAVAHIFQ